MKGGSRPQRVAELIKKEIAGLIMRGLKDPRIGFVSVMGVEMSPDLRYASVYVSLFGSESEKKSSLIALQRSSGWVRREIGKALRLRFTPEVRFFVDETLERVYHLEEVLKQVHEQDEDGAPAAAEATDAAGIVAALREAESVLVVSHANPDGDAVGSVLGTAALLRQLGKTVHTALPDPPPSTLSFLVGSEAILTPVSERPEFDTLLIVDTADLSRIGELAQWVFEDTRVLVVDHHQPHTPDGDLVFIDPSYAAAAELVFELYEAAGVSLDHDSALALYVGQSTDTGCYRFRNTNARTHRIASRLLECGIDVAEVCCQLFDMMTPQRLDLLRRFLDRLERTGNGRLAYSYLTLADFGELGTTRQDAEGFVNYARNINGVEVGALFTEAGPNETKLSLRSHGAFNVADFAHTLGGGGHAGAAGVTLAASLEAARTQVLEKLVPAVERLG